MNCSTDFYPFILFLLHEKKLRILAGLFEFIYRKLFHAAENYMLIK